MSDVYVLPSPPPTLYVYPSIQHAGGSGDGSGGGMAGYAYELPPPRKLPRPTRTDDETALAVLGLI